MSNFLLGGRMGDLVHSLYVAKNTPGTHDLYITDRRDLHSDGFLYDLQTTFDELYTILMTQGYCKSFQIYQHELVQNLSMWRRYAYSACWTQLLANTFNVPTNGEPWIKWHSVDLFSDEILVHCSNNPARRGHHWDVVMNMYEGRTHFIGTDEEFKAFGYNIPHYQPRTLADYFTAINSCKFFIGNQSAPLAIAHALGKTRLAMLNEVDKLHYTGEEKFCDNFYWIAKETNYFEALNFENVK